MREVETLLETKVRTMAEDLRFSAKQNEELDL
jgi:hypothetical protein